MTSLKGERGFVASHPTKLVLSSLSDLSCPLVVFIVACATDTISPSTTNIYHSYLATEPNRFTFFQH